MIKQGYRERLTLTNMKNEGLEYMGITVTFEMFLSYEQCKIAKPIQKDHLIYS